MRDGQEPNKLRWVVCGLLFLATVVNYMDRSVLGLVEPILKHMLGGDDDPARFARQYGRIVACFVFAYGIGYVPAGRIVDRIGAKKGYALAILIWGCASIGHVFARSAIGFGAARFALGLGEAGNFPAALKATADWFPPEERAFATGIFNAATSAAPLVAPLLIPFVAVTWGWQAAFLTTGGLSLLWLVVWLLFPYRRLLGKASGTADAPAMPRRSLLSLFTDIRTWRFALSKFMTDPVWWFYLFWLPKYIHERFAVDLLKLGPPLIVIYAGATIGSIGAGWLAATLIRRTGSLLRGRRLTLLICALGSLVVPAVPFIESLPVVVVLLTLAVAAHQGWSSNLFSTPSDMFETTSVATVVGIGGAVGSVGSALFTLVVGQLWTEHSWVICVYAGLAYLLAFFALQSWPVAMIGQLGAGQAGATTTAPPSSADI